MAPSTLVLPLERDRIEAGKGRQEIVEDTMMATPMAALPATLDRGDPAPTAGDPLPPR
jgi:3-methylfumaryl-CoA hydratase